MNINLTGVLKNKRQDIIQVASKHGARNVRVFGSVARGQSGPGSDLDLLVQLDPGYSLLDIVAIKQDLEDLLGCNVDVVTEAALSPYIRDQMHKEAISLCWRSERGYTCLSFTAEALAHIDKVPESVAFIDGKKLTQLMIEHNVGVNRDAVYEIKKIDLDFFSGS